MIQVCDHIGPGVQVTIHAHGAGVFIKPTPNV
jgi:hypothetical protein